MKHGKTPPAVDAAGKLDGMPPTEPGSVEKKKTMPKHIVYYISTEVNRDRLERMFASRGWFAEDDYLFMANPETGSTSGLHVINPPMEIERPVKSSEEIVNFIVRQIAVQPPPEEGQFVFIVVDSITSLFKDCAGGDSRRQVYELIHRLRGQFARGTEHGMQIGSLGMILLLSEQGLENTEDSPGIETYVADIVFTLGLKSLSMGMRLRTLEITKSQGANILMGTHTWHILTDLTHHRLIKGDTLRKELFSEVSWSEKGRDFEEDEDREKEKKIMEKVGSWGTIVVAPRPDFSRVSASKTNEGRNNSDESSGICGLDEMLRFDPDYWFMEPEKVIKRRAGEFRDHMNGSDDRRPYDRIMHTSIKAGSVTMLVGEPGTGKTSLCYHLVASHLARNHFTSDHPVSGDHVALLVGFEHDFSPSFQSFGGKFRYGPGNLDVLGDEDFNKCEIIFRPRSVLHFNLLLLEIRAWLRKHENHSKRVVIDGISHLSFSHTRDDVSKMLDALVALFAEGDGRKSSVFLTYEALQSGSVLDSDTLRLPADNIVRFSHQVIDDVRRTAVTVIKSSQPEYDNMVRELALDHRNPALTHILSGFDAYSGLLAGRVRNADVVLQLFQENPREKAYNLALREHLNTLLPYRITLRDFSRFELTSSLEGNGENVKVPSGSVQVSHIDEWWLAHKVKVLSELAAIARKRSDGNGTEAPGISEAEAWQAFRKFVYDNQLTNLGGFVGTEEGSPISQGDFWCFETDKTWVPDESGKARMNIGPYGLPSYMDFGMLCVHGEVLGEEAPECHTDYVGWDNFDELPWDTINESPDEMSGREHYANVLDNYLRPWCEPQEIETAAGKLEWFAKPVDGESKTLVDVMITHKGKKTNGTAGRKGEAYKLKYGFAWDSRTPETAAGFVYELAWAFGGSFDLFVNQENKFEKKGGGKELNEANEMAVQRALAFIGFLVHEDLMPVGPTLTDTAQSVFSRHYYSTYIDVVHRMLAFDPRSQKKEHVGMRKSESRLVSLGFMPPGPEKWQDVASIANDRVQRWSKLEERKTLMKKLRGDESGHGDESLDSELSDPKYFTRSPNSHDILEMERWWKYREYRNGATNWEEALKRGECISKDNEPVGERGGVEPETLRTGYGCCGAWMVGIKSPTGAPGLAQVLLQEITSLNFAKKRARMGAGMPARQDFYRYYGDRPVTGMEYMTWNEMLMYMGSTGRRRDRLFAGPLTDENGKAKKASNPAEMHRRLHQAVVAVMTMAAKAPKNDPTSIIEVANQYTKKVFGFCRAEIAE